MPTIHAPADLWASRDPGTYLLLLRLDATVTLAVGRLRPVAFPSGWYVYVGSALGGLGPRLRRHAALEKRHHWHIDVLRAASQLVAVAVHVGSERVECQAARIVGAWPGGTQPVPRFGASDCRCPSHLIHFTAAPDLQLDRCWQVVRLG